MKCKREPILRRLENSFYNEKRKHKNIKSDFGYIPIDGQYCFMDGISMYILNDSYGYPTKQPDIPLESVFPKKQGVDIKVDINDLKAFISALKKKHIPRWDDKHPYIIKIPEEINVPYEHELYLNGDFLLDFLRILDTDTITYYDFLKPISAIGKDGEWGLLCIKRKNHPI